MICQLCKSRRATLHITEAVGKDRKELHVCQECARQKGLAQNPFTSLAEILGEPEAKKPGKKKRKTAKEKKEDKIRCPTCGLTLEIVRKKSRLGCHHDVEVFQTWLDPLLERTQGSIQHMGKIPRHTEDIRRKEAELLKLKRDLEEAVRNEDFEKAAKLRDEIRDKDDEASGTS